MGRAQRCQLELNIDPKLGRLPEALELSMFRIVQEGLNNIRKHAQARQVSLRVERTPTASILVRLMDDGQGLPKPIDLAESLGGQAFRTAGDQRTGRVVGRHDEGGIAHGRRHHLASRDSSPYPSM